MKRDLIAVILLRSIYVSNVFLLDRLMAARILHIFTVFVFLSAFSVAFAQETEEDPVKLFNSGQEAHEKGDVETALTFYNRALDIFPEFPEAEYQKGTALLSLRKTVEAEKAFRQALELRENWTLPMTSLGVLLVQNNQYVEAEELLTKAIQISGLNFLAYTALTELRIKTNASPEVLKLLLSKIQFLTSKANPTAALWASRAALERTLGDKKAAIASLDRAILIDPLDKVALAEHAELSLGEGDHKAALSDALKLKELAPDSANVDFLLARVHASAGELEKANEIIAGIKDPTAEVAAFRDKILSVSSTNIGELESKLEIDKYDIAALGRLCSLLRVDVPEKALEYCRRASEIDPRNLNHAIGYGAALVTAKRYPDAISLLKRILEVSPENYTVHTNLATALFQSQRFAEAKTEYNWIVRKQPDLAIAYYLLAITHDRLEEYMDAAANYQQFLRIADVALNQLEIDKVNLRLPVLQKLIKQGKGKKNG